MVNEVRKASRRWMSSRNILWHLVFWGFAVNYMVRINLNIAIVSMIRTNHRFQNASSECLVYNNVSGELVSSSNNTNKDREGFAWDEHQQSLILGAFFWIFWMSPVPGGLLSHRFGTKRVFGYSNLAMCLLGLTIPAAANYHYIALILVRMLQGFIGGVCWPSMHNMAANWIPPNERSRFVTAYLGSSVGAGLTYPICGLLIDWFDWPAVFHATALIGCAWFTAWWFLVFDTPASHPRIDKAERDFIVQTIGRNVVVEKPPVPWVSILTCKAVWMTTIAQCGGLWGLFTLLTQAPTYLKQVHGWDIRMTGFLSGMPHFCRVFFAYIFSHFADLMIKRNPMNQTAIRKFATVVCTIGQGVFIFGLAFCGCNWLAAIVCITLATMLNGAVSSGPLATFVDLGPNYASITLGLSNMVGVLPGFLSPVLVGALTYQNQTVGQWQIVFFISTAILVLPGMLYVFCASSSLQAWNSPPLSSSKKDEKLPLGQVENDS